MSSSDKVLTNLGRLSVGSSGSVGGGSVTWCVTSDLELQSNLAARDLGLWGQSCVYGAGLEIRMTAHTLSGFPLSDSPLWLNACCSPPQGLPLSKAWRLKLGHYLQMLGGCVCVCLCVRERDWSASGRLEKSHSVRYGCRQRRHTLETPPQRSMASWEEFSSALSRHWANIQHARFSWWPRPCKMCLLAKKCY